MQNKLVLIIDDNPMNLLLTSKILENNKFRTLTAENGKDGIQLIENELPALILLDIIMPDMDGYEICRHIKKTAKLKHTQVVFMSAKSKEADIQKGYDLGAALYITKPFSTRELVKQIKELLTT